MRLRLRSAGAGDAPVVTALHIASWRDTHRGIFEDAFLDAELEPAAARHWQIRLAAPQRAVVVVLAMLGGDAAGFVAMRRREAVAQVESLHVRPGLRGAGIGRALLAFAARRMEHRGCAGAELIVFARNAGAIRFCTALGGVLGPEEDGLAFGQPVQQRRCDWADITRLIAAASTKA